MDIKELNLEQAKELYEFLQGKFMPDGYELKNIPKLNQKKAFTIIYILQTHFRVVKDTIEPCDNCRELFDTDSDGEYHDCFSCEDEWCKKRYPLADFEELKKALNYKFFCNECCEMNYLAENGVI